MDSADLELKEAKSGPSNDRQSRSQVPACSGGESHYKHIVVENVEVHIILECGMCLQSFYCFYFLF